MRYYITKIFAEQYSQFGAKNKYFIIKGKNDNGEQFEILPNSGVNTYSEWLKIKEIGEGAIMEGLQFQNLRKGIMVMNNKVLPTSVHSNKKYD